MSQFTLNQPPSSGETSATRCATSAALSTVTPWASSEADVRQLMEEIGHQHHRLREQLAESLEQARAIGDNVLLLLAAVGYGKYGKVVVELRNKYGLSHRTLELYAQVRRNWHLIQQAVENQPELARTLTLRNVRQLFRDHDIVDTRPTNNSVPHGHISQYTRRSPDEIVKSVQQAFGAIDTDPAADDGKTIPATHHFTIADNGLQNMWHGVAYVFLDEREPLREWVKFAGEQLGEELRAAVFFLPSDTTDERALSDLAAVRATFILLTKRLVFPGQRRVVPPSSTLVHVGDGREEFRRGCGPMGQVLAFD